VRDERVTAAEARLNELLGLILETAVDVLGFDAATVTARHAESLSTVAATDQRLVELDNAQYGQAGGPCVSVLDTPEASVTLEDIAADDRWQTFREAARELDVASSLSIHVPAEAVEGVAASLNFYARKQRRLGDEQVRVAAGFAAQVGATMLGVEAYRTTARLASGLAEAMRTRAVIEQAKGIVMAERNVDADGAFEILRRMSHDRNVKLREVAQEIVTARATG
jgi:hypothetical protein